MAQIARRLGVSISSVRDHKQKEGWVHQDPEPDVLADTVTAAFAGDQTYDATDDPTVEYERKIADLEAKLADAERRAAEAKAEADEYNPNYEFHQYTTVDEVIGQFGIDRLRRIVASTENARRKKEGFLAIDFSQDWPQLDPQVKELAADILARRTRFAGTRNQRTVKLWFKGNLIQTPVETQISNEAGQQGAALWKMRAKGAKLVVPYVCQLADCWREAVIDDTTGRFKFHGYCSEDHEARDPYLRGRRVAGATTSGAWGAGQGLVGAGTVQRSG